MPKFNQRIFTKDVLKTMTSKQMKEEAYRVVQNKVEQADRNMVQNFESHPVTRELDSGPDSSNLSGALGGYGNLFSFIGFNRGDTPTEIIRKYLQRGSRVYRNPRVISSSRSVDMIFKVKTVSLEDLEALTPSPWEGKSWLKGVETGISGLGYYIHENSDNSRSGKGYQSKNKIRSLIFKPVKYMTSIMQKFNEDLR